MGIDAKIKLAGAGLFASGLFAGMMLAGIYSIETTTAPYVVWRVNHVTGTVSVCRMRLPSVICASE